MKSFGIGLALLLSGSLYYFLASALKNAFNAISSLGLISATTEIPEALINIAPYICIGIMAFGVLWFWIVEPVLYLTAPRKPKRESVKEAAVVPSATIAERVEPAAPTGKDLKQLVSEAIEQWVTDAIREKIEREKGK